MVSYLRRQGTPALSLLGVLVLAITFFLLAAAQAPVHSVEVGIAEQSPLGHSGGSVVPASCPSYDHSTGGQCAPCSSGYDYDMNGNCVSTSVPDPISPPGNPHYLLDQPGMNGPVCNVAGNQVTLSWGPVPNAEVYALRVDNSTNNNVSCLDGWHCNITQDLIRDALTATTYVHDIVPGVKYFWWVHAKYADSWAGTSGFTKLEFICMAPPASMTASCDVSGTSATLSWSSSTGALQYQPRIKSPVAITQAQCPSGWTLFTDGQTCFNNDYVGTSVSVPVVSGRTYDAWVHSEGDNGWSSSDTHIPGGAFTCTAPVAPVAPSSMTASCGAGGTSLTLSWSSASGATFYNPRFSKPSMGSCPSGWTLTGGTTCYRDGYSSTSVTVPILANTAYDAWVQSGNTAGVSAGATHIPGNSISCPSSGDLCANLSGSQSTVPTGYTASGGNCTPTSGDYCPNITGVQSSVPSGYTVASNGTCTPTSGDFCSNLNGTQATIPAGYTANANGTCSPTSGDFCSNVAGTQATIPAGYTANADGTCTLTSSGPTISCSAASVTAGGTISGTVTGGTSGTDWIGVFASGASDSAFSDWSYVTLPRPKTVAFTAPATAGNYQLRVFANNGSVSANSCNFTVTGGGGGVSAINVTETGADVDAYTALDDQSSTWYGIPNAFAPISVAAHTVFFTNIPGQIATVGTCTSSGGCTPPSYSAASCSGTVCWVNVTTTNNSSTNVQVVYTTAPTTGSVSVSRVGANGLTSSAPAGTTASLDGGTASASNPASFSNVSAANHTVTFTDIAGYDERVGTCTGVSCTPSSYGTTPSCNGTTCTASSIAVSAGVTTGVGVQYTVTACTPDPSSPQTQTLSCPVGQTGSITQMRTSSCPGPAWSSWSTTSNTCVVGGVPVLTLSTSASLVAAGDSVTISWSATGVTSCAITGPGYSATGTSGGPVTVGPIDSKSTFTLTCQTTGGPQVASVVVNVVPRFDEQ